MATIKPDISTVWASAPDFIQDPGDAKIAQGWIKEIPLNSFQNFWQNRADTFLQHVNEFGIPQWDPITIYPLNGYVAGSDGLIYRSVIASNEGNDPISSPSKWKIAFEQVITGDLALSVPSEFATIDDAIDFLNKQIITPQGLAVIEVTGIIQHNSPILLNHPNSDRIIIKGVTTPISINITGISLVDFANAPVQEVTYTVADSTGIVINDIVLIKDTIPVIPSVRRDTRNAGVWKVIDVQPTSITVEILGATDANFIVTPVDFSSATLIKIQDGIVFFNDSAFDIQSSGFPRLENLLFTDASTTRTNPYLRVTNSGFTSDDNTFLIFNNNSPTFSVELNNSSIDFYLMAMNGSTAGGLKALNSKIQVNNTLISTGFQDSINTLPPLTLDSFSELRGDVIILSSNATILIDNQSSLISNEFFAPGTSTTNHERILLISNHSFMNVLGLSTAVWMDSSQRELIQADNLSSYISIGGDVFFVFINDNINVDRLISARHGSYLDIRNAFLISDFSPGGPAFVARAIIDAEFSSTIRMEGFVFGNTDDFSIPKNFTGDLVGIRAQYVCTRNSTITADSSIFIFTSYVAIMSSFEAFGLANDPINSNARPNANAGITVDGAVLRTANIPT